jgi:hypothetical protein
MRVTGKLLFLAFLMVLFLSSCKKSEIPQTPSLSRESKPGQQAVTSSTPAAVAGQTPSSPANALAQAKAKTDACALLTNSEVESVQKETTKETKLTGASQGGFSVSQCFFTLPTFTNSISLQVTQKGEGTGARDPKEFWRATFHQEQRTEKERERDREKSTKKEEDEEMSVPPQRVTGVGDEAFWMGSRVGGALYVLKGNNYLRISVGGSGDTTEKIKKSKALAQKVVPRL